eukprot:3134856-Lingulodinium_polyedra.AAC.1
MPGHNMQVVDWVPPGTELAKRVLTQASPSGNPAVAGLRAKLRDAWAQRHTPLQHDQLPSCKPRSGLSKFRMT